jgi:L-fuculose-phosphate aldolase
MSAGGQAMTTLMAEALQAPKGCSMLDIGFGIGGAAFGFAESLDATIRGVDVGVQGHELAQAELAQRNKARESAGLTPLKITFALEDCSQADYAPESFDVIYSRDTFVHLSAESKEKVFANCYKWLKPGGKICIADYSLGRNSHQTGEPTPAFATYLQARDYHMYTASQYSTALETAGFTGVNSRDMAHWYCITCQTELDRVSQPGPSRDKCLEEEGEEQTAKLEQTYLNKVQMTLRGDRSYVLITGVKGSDANGKSSSLEAQVQKAYLKLYNKGWVMSCDGNLSARVAPGSSEFFVTPTGIDADEIDPSQIVRCNGNGKTDGAIKPTSEVDLHSLIYQSRPDVGAIVHSHSIYACAIACCRIPLPPTHYAVCELMCDPTLCKVKDAENASAVQCSTYHTYGTFELATATLAALGQNYACFLANHGAVVVGEDLKEAMYLTERLERECEIYWRAKQLSRPIPLTPEEITSLAVRDQTYGQNPDGEQSS